MPDELDKKLFDTFLDELEEVAGATKTFVLRWKERLGDSFRSFNDVEGFLTDSQKARLDKIVESVEEVLDQT